MVVHLGRNGNKAAALIVESTREFTCFVTAVALSFWKRTVSVLRVGSR